MSTITILAPHEELVGELISRCVSDGADYSKNTIIFPGKRPAHVLRKTLADRLKTSFIPPRIFSIDEWIESLYRDSLGLHKKKLGIADALSVLFDIHSKAKEKIGDSNYASLDAFIPVGIKLFGELEEVAIAYLSTKHISNVVGAIPFPKFHALAEYYEKFYSTVEKEGLVTRSMMYRTVAERIKEIDLSSTGQLFLAGFFAFTKAEKRIIEDLRELDNVQLVFQNGAGLREKLADIDIHFKEGEYEGKSSLTSKVVQNERDGDSSQAQNDTPRGEGEYEGIPTPMVHFIAAPDLHGQVFSLAAKIKERIEKNDAMNHRVAMALPTSDAVFPLYHHVLSLIPNEEYNIALGYPITRTPAYGFLVNLMDLVGSEVEGTYSSSEYMKFLLHPYAKNIKMGTRSDITRIVVHTIEEYIAERGIMRVRLDSIVSDDALFERMKKIVSRVDEHITIEKLREHVTAIHAKTIIRFTGFTSVRDCAEKASEILEYIFENSTARLHPYFRPYVERLIDALESTSQSLLAGKYFTEPAGYFSFLRHLLAVESVPFSGTPLKGVQALGLLETRNLSFDTLYMLDMNDEIVPGKPDADLLLPQHVRNNLGLETYRERELLIEYYFSLAVSGAKEVFFFYSRSGSGKNERSRFIEKLLWQVQQRDSTISTEDYELPVKYQVQLANERPEAIQKTKEMIAWMHESLRISATTLDTYNACQLRFYYRSILRLDEKEEAKDEMDALIVGKVIHEILSEYFEPFIGVPLKKDMLTIERLQHVTDLCFHQQFGEMLTGTAALFKQKAFEHLKEFLEGYQIPLVEKEEVVILSLEKLFHVEKDGVNFIGRIDRVEMRGKKFYILDYKTGADDTYIRIRLDSLVSDDRSTWREAIRSFQLPMYMLMYNEMTQKGIENIIPAYLFLGKPELNDEIEVGMERDEDSSADVYKEVEPIMFKMIQEILDPAKEFVPTNEIEKECPGCAYKVICGTQWAVKS